MSIPGRFHRRHQIFQGAGGSLTSAEVKAEKYLGRILSENYEVMIYDGEIGEELLEILGGNILHKGVETK